MKKFNLYNTSFLQNHTNMTGQYFPVAYLVGMAYSEYNRGVNTNTRIKENMLSYLGGAYFEPTICIDLQFYQSQIDEYKQNLTFKIIEDSITPYEKAMIETFKHESIPFSQLTKYVGKIASFPKTYEMMKEHIEFEDFVDTVRNKSDYFGLIKKRYNIKLKIISKKYLSKTGIYTVNAVDDSDNLFFWFESKKRNFKVNDIVKVRATIKKHIFSDYLKARENHLSRVVYC